MSRVRKLIPKDFAKGDFTVIRVTVERKPVLEFAVDGDGDIKPRIKERSNPTLISIPLLSDPSGSPVIPVNLYLHHVGLRTQDPSTLNTHAQALLLFYRYLNITNKTIYDCTRDRERGVVYAFRDYMVDNLKKDVEIEGNLVMKGTWEPSTGAAYVGVVVQFYSFLHVERIIRFTDDFVPFEYTIKRVRKSEPKNSQHSLLGHIKKGDRGYVVVKTTGLLKPFKGERTRSSFSHKLTPMLQHEKDIFYKCLVLDGNFKTADEVKDLMLYLATETGLRLEEMVTFPATEVNFPTLDKMPVLLSPIKNGCKTKYDKARTIEVPRHVMDLLFRYKTSKARKRALDRALVPHNCLFISHAEGRYYSPNTIEKYFEKIRNQINNEKLHFGTNWYFTIHDTRSTFATDWIYEQVTVRALPIAVLIDELSDLMGHKDATTTSKYIKYMENDKNWSLFSQRKNEYMRDLMRM